MKLIVVDECFDFSVTDLPVTGKIDPEYIQFSEQFNRRPVVTNGSASDALWPDHAKAT